MKKIAILGNQEVTSLIIQYLNDYNINISCVVSLSPNKGDKISEYVNLSNLSNFYGIKMIYVDDYSLKSEKCRSLFENETFDLVLVAGWGRLIPDSLLSLPNTKFIGWHGGPYLPPRCRGRAVVNWSIINNESDFFIYTMLLDKGVDSGNIVETSSVNIQANETAQTLYIKCSIEISKLFQNFIKNPYFNKGVKQTNIGKTYLPKRSPEDGEIDWKLPAKVITRLINALSKPFPPAWSIIHEKKLFIKKARTIDCAINQDLKYGQILNKLSSGEILVKTSKDLLFIEEYEYFDKKILNRFDVFNKSSNTKNITMTY